MEPSLLPELWNIVIDFLSMNDACSLAKTNHFFHTRVHANLNYQIKKDFVKKKYFPTEGLEKATFLGHKDLIDFCIKKGATAWETGMKVASEDGRKYLVDFFIEKGACGWDGGMAGAACGGHEDLVKFFVERGANDWDWGMVEAVRGGHKKLVDFFIKKGFTDWILALEVAVLWKHKDLIQFFGGAKKGMRERHILDNSILMHR